jgi:exodeoxyribonuclease III
VKLISWNVNGIRACGRAGFADWFADQRADVVAIQEVKAFPEQLEEPLLHPGRYHSYWHPAKKPGYSGVAIYARKEPLALETGIGDPAVDDEGRILIARFAGFTLLNAYFPNSQREGARLPYKLEFCRKILAHARKRRKAGEHVVICGDFNIAHQEIDLRNPKSNQKNAGFLPEERAWMTKFLEAGFVDTFRHFNPDARDRYTWWSYRPGVRERNIGWRIDYFAANQELRDRLGRVAHQDQVRGSDHCPVELRLRD